MKIRALLACLLACATLARADDALARSVDRFVAQYIAKKQVPGVAVLVRSQGKVVLARGYGFANLEHRVPVKPETVFQSGSMGKQFTAMLICMLADEGKLALDDPVGKYLEVPESWKGITLRHLLTHTSGLGDYPDNFSLQKDYSEDDLWKMITAQPPASAPGEKWKYSNLGYVTLGILIHKVSGRFYGDLLRERIFTPLGMTRTRIISERDIVADRAAGYVLKDGALQNQEWVSPTLNTTADGSLYFTVEDLAKWDAALEARKLVSPAMYREMWTPVRLSGGSTADYGFGWSLHTLPGGHRVIEHGGAWQGFASYIARYPDDKLTVVALGNRAGADVGYIAHVVAGHYRPELAPVKHRAVKLPAATLANYAGEYRLEEDKVTVMVAAAGDHLLATLQGEKLELLPESESEFFEEDSERGYRFERDPSGAVTSLTLSVPEKLVFRRVR
jgi:CubicO group peptidase (beta-lactamase class C family)